MEEQTLIFKYFRNMGNLTDKHTLAEQIQQPFHRIDIQQYTAELLVVKYKPANGRNDIPAEIAYIKRCLFRQYGKGNIKGLTIYTDELCQNIVPNE